ncbi:Hypothetical predicted protein [Drosophila guanche]|uniref:Uncharacterized protein n=1 Tax=Drosophila guanche TaxID=7266 RepID=A0A3B0JSB6_DROGU|nr:Hypothetical predicted protein [Drosophila guanche]
MNGTQTGSVEEFGEVRFGSARLESAKWCEDQLVDDVEALNFREPVNELNIGNEIEQDSRDEGSSTTALDEKEIMGAGSREGLANFASNQVGYGRDDVESDQESVASLPKSGAGSLEALAYFDSNDEFEEESKKKLLQIGDTCVIYH